MTDKEIIIDGVNVARCKYYLSTGYCQLQMIFQGMILKLPFGKHLECNLCEKDCYYKQLKRLEAENKLLKGTLKDKNFVAIVENNEKLEAENAKLKEDLRICCTCERTKDNYMNVLQNIKEIAEEYHHNKPRLLCTMDKFIEQILQKISEVED